MALPIIAASVEQLERLRAAGVVAVLSTPVPETALGTWNRGRGRESTSLYLICFGWPSDSRSFWLGEGRDLSEEVSAAAPDVDSRTAAIALARQRRRPWSATGNWQGYAGYE